MLGILVLLVMVRVKFAMPCRLQTRVQILVRQHVHCAMLGCIHSVLLLVHVLRVLQYPTLPRSSALRVLTKLWPLAMLDFGWTVVNVHPVLR